MGRYLMTHSLLASWLYTMKENPYEDMTTERDPMGEFMQTLRRDPTPTTEAMQNGIKFEDMVTDIINGCADPNDPWYAAAEKVARRCRSAGAFPRKRSPCPTSPRRPASQSATMRSCLR